MSIKGFEKIIIAIILLGLTLGSINYAAHMTNTVSQLKTESLEFQDHLLETQQQLSEVSDNYFQLQDQITGQGRQYTGNPFSTQLWPGQLQSENITGMHWYSLYNGALVNCTNNVLGLGLGEGDYTTWTHVWTMDYGSAAMIYNILVDNSGTVYSEDNWWDTYLKTYGGAETNLSTYIIFKDEVMVNPMSMTGKYVLGDPITAQSEFEVFKDGVVVFNRDANIDEANVKDIANYNISPNGKFIALSCYNFSLKIRYVMLYEGS